MENRKRRIAFYIGSLDKGGAERVIVNLAEYFYSQDYEVYVVTKLKEINEYTLNPGITRIIADITTEEETKSRLFNLYARIHKLRQVWKTIKPDVIVSFIRKNNVMAIASSRFLSIPVVVSVRSDPKRELQGRIMKKLSLFMFRFADGIVLQTNQAKAFLSSTAIKSPFSSFCMRSAGPPHGQSVETTAIPNVIASIKALGIPSHLDDNTKIEAFFIFSATFEICPIKKT